MSRSEMEIVVKFLPGTDLKEALYEAKTKAVLWNVAYISFEFNDVEFSIGSNADIDDVICEWQSLINEDGGLQGRSICAG